MCRLFARRFLKLVACLFEAEEYVLAYHGFPGDHRAGSGAPTSLKRLSKPSADAATL